MAKEKKFLDYEGVKHLWSKVNMQDYPNNDMLMSVIQAIDDTKMDKLETVVFSGQYTTNSGRVDFPELTQDMIGKIGVLYDYRGSIVAKNPIEAHREPGTSVISYPYWEGGGFYFLPYWLSEDGKDGWHTTRGDNETERYTFSIITLLDEKYIPNTIARVNDILQSDWNQGDSSKLDYIQNKPFYDNTTITTFIPETTGIVKRNGLSYMHIEGYENMPWVIGNKLYIKWDGVEYESVCFENGDGLYEYPINVNGHWIGIYDHGGVFNFDGYFGDEGESHTYEIYSKEINVKTLDPKFVETDPTLFLEGYPADAKSVGDAINLAKPFIINVSDDKIADKTWEEIWEAREAGRNILCKYYYNTYQYVGEGYDFSIFVCHQGNVVRELYLYDWHQNVETSEMWLLTEHDITSDDEIIKMLVELDMVAAVADSDNAMLTDENENILLW